ncbi:flagellar export chaperone FliS [Pseudomonas sp. ABC1]|uniref:flagellar export chaperone FliS n=1 Tax=Pseudomonas sp. ABC1 TaxID=2748080 RepID=UPI0015C38B62|nr:flagellar export chaperone FliS [Pseudomonas sp. ABC1]QLF92467.1 flagellar export chaperone FliS [Pseudomonas sp. ABC1]
MTSPIDVYRQTSISQEVSNYRAVQLLLDGAIERVYQARQAQQQGDAAVRGLAVGSTLDILSVLQASLDKELGGAIAENLDVLYDYMIRRLGGVAVETSQGSLNEVLELLVQIRDAWVAIGPEVEPAAG